MEIFFYKRKRKEKEIREIIIGKILINID